MSRWKLVIMLKKNPTNVFRFIWGTSLIPVLSVGSSQTNYAYLDPIESGYIKIELCGYHIKCVGTL